MSATLPNKPHFFKPLLPGFEDDFLIPAAYSKYLREQKCENAMLGSRKGEKLWPVKINGRRFEDGWKQFVKDHDLEIGDFLVFRHEGDLVFYVLVFDRTSCEREYSPFTVTEEENVEIQEQNLLEDSGNEEENVEIQEQNLPEDSSNGKNLEEMKKTKASSGATNRENPCSIIQLTSNSLKKSRLHIPRKFAREHGLDDRCCSMILKDEEENCWPALFYKSSNGKTYIAGGWTSFCVAHKLKAGGSLLIELTKNGTIPVLKMKRLQEVKPEIMDQNNTEDDSLVPGHLQAPTEASHLQKSHPQVPEGGAEKSGLGKEMEKKKASSSFLEYPSFVITLDQNSLKSDRVYIPQKFAREQGLLYIGCSLVFLKDEKGYCWPAKLLQSRLRSGTTCVGDGWTSFRIAHDLKSGDSVIFELIKFGMVPILKIRKLQKNLEVREEVVNQNNAEADSPLPGHFHATTEASNLEKSHPKIPEEVPEKSGFLKKLEKNKKVKTKLEPKACSTNLEHPNCVIKLTLDSILRSKLHIPGKFARQCGLNSRSRSLILKDEEEKCWPAKLNYTKRKFLVREGWGAFHRVHKLKPGDSLIVELVKTGKTPVIKIRR